MILNRRVWICSGSGSGSGFRKCFRVVHRSILLSKLGANEAVTAVSSC